MSLLSAAKHEAKEVGLVTLYFLFCFGIVLALLNLVLEDYAIEALAISTAVIAALVVAKVVVVLDKTAAGTRFESTRPLAVAALYKTLVYAVATLVVLYLEKLFEAYREAGSLERAIVELWGHRDLYVVLAKVLCISVAFAGYHFYAGLDRRLGAGTLRRLLLSFDRPPAGRDAPST